MDSGVSFWVSLFAAVVQLVAGGGLVGGLLRRLGERATAMRKELAERMEIRRVLREFAKLDPGMSQSRSVADSAPATDAAGGLVVTATIIASADVIPAADTERQVKLLWAEVQHLRERLETSDSLSRAADDRLERQLTELGESRRPRLTRTEIMLAIAFVIATVTGAIF